MNERIGNSKIYALAKEAGLIEFEQFAWNPELGSPTYESVAKARKFAELIVQEILRLLEQYSRDSFPEDFIDNFDKGYLAGLCTAQEAVKKHFGVEE